MKPWPHVFIAPRSLETQSYRLTYPEAKILRFPDYYFASIKGYNQLMLSQEFYSHFCNFEFVLLLQTDAIILRDDLAHWCKQPYDWIGAPWPNGQTYTIHTDLFRTTPKKVHTHVGNGGLSLRRVQNCQRLLTEFPESVANFLENSIFEDLFFSVIGTQAPYFTIPNERTAALFSVELQPEFYFQLNQTLPMGGHAWWRYNLDFWLQHLTKVPPPDTLASCTPHPAKPSLTARIRKLFQH